MSDFKEQCEEYRKSVGDSQFCILDVNGVKIKTGDKVQTIQFPGGVLLPERRSQALQLNAKMHLVSQL